MSEQRNMPESVSESDVYPIMSQSEFRWAKFRRSLMRAKPAMLGGIFLILLVVVSLSAPLIALQNPSMVDVNLRLKPLVWLEGGSANYLLGTDALGRDILSRLIYGGRVSILVGLSSVVISGVIGIVLGLVSGFFGGKIDGLISGFSEIQLAFPFILLAGGGQAPDSSRLRQGFPPGPGLGDHHRPDFRVFEPHR